MNVYLIADGGDHKLWKAMTMADAMRAAEDAFIAECREALAPAESFDEEETRAEYRSDGIESCALVGELANP